MRCDYRASAAQHACIIFIGSGVTDVVYLLGCHSGTLEMDMWQSIAVVVWQAGFDFMVNIRVRRTLDKESRKMWLSLICLILLVTFNSVCSIFLFSPPRTSTPRSRGTRKHDIFPPSRRNVLEIYWGSFYINCYNACCESNWTLESALILGAIVVRSRRERLSESFDGFFPPLLASRQVKASSIHDFNVLTSSDKPRCKHSNNDSGNLLDQ